MRKSFSLLLALALCLGCALPAWAEEAGGSAVIDGILSAQAIKSYTDEAVSQADLDAILQAGAKAPSARNGQPWHFTVVTNAEALSALGAGGGLMIVISGQDAAGNGMNVDFDCGLATQNMYLAAHSLGLGANIVMGPVSRAGEMRDTLGIPEGYSPLMVLTVGHYDADAVSAATERNALADITNYVE